MPRWTNPKITLFHGTDSVAAGALGAVPGDTLPFVVNLALCKPSTDFGQGFYTTTRLHQAKQWANMRVLRVAPSPGLYAVVITFQVDRDWLASMDNLSFVRATHDFWDLVTDCRIGFPPHQRVPPRPVPYDVVAGPVTLYPQKLIISDCDQFSFHTRRAVAGLPFPELQACANERNPLAEFF